MKIPLLVMLAILSGISPLLAAVPELSATECDAVIAAANQAVHQHVRAEPQDRESNRISEKFWGEAVTQLKPLRVMMDRMNTMIVLSEKDGSEEGFYVTNPISSYAPGHDGRFTTFETVREQSHRIPGTLYHYRIAAAAVEKISPPIREKIESMIKRAPVTTNYLADLFELTPGSRSEYRLRPDIVSIPLPASEKPGLETPQEKVFHLPAGNKFYIQSDGLGASTLHYYGPFFGDPVKMLELLVKPETTMNADVPEFLGFELKMSEETLNRLILERRLSVRVVENEGMKSYQIFRRDGENVIVMFRDGGCTGIQRMQRDPDVSAAAQTSSNPVKEIQSGMEVRLHSAEVRREQANGSSQWIVYFKSDLRSPSERILPHYGAPIGDFLLEMDGKWFEQMSRRASNLASVAPSPATVRTDLHNRILHGDWRSIADRMPMFPFEPGKHALRIGLPLAGEPDASGQRPFTVSNSIEITIPAELPELNGASSNGLRLECRPIAEKFATDQLVSINCRVTNTTNVLKPVGWSVNGGAHFCLESKARPYQGGLLPGTAPRLDGSLTVRDGYPPFSMKILYLPPGQSVEINLNCGYFEKPQRFEGRIVYDPLSSRGGGFKAPRSDGKPSWVDELVSSEDFSFDVVAPANIPASPFVFDPVAERVIRNSGKDCWALNLASGKVVTSTEESPLDFRVGAEDNLRKAGIDLYQPIYANAGYLVKMLDMLIVPLDENGWDAPAEDIQAKLKAAGESWDLVKSDGWVDSHKHPFAFRTRDGTTGVLRVPEAAPFTLRYKLILPENK